MLRQQRERKQSKERTGEKRLVRERGKTVELSAEGTGARNRERKHRQKTTTTKQRDHTALCSATDTFTGC